MAHRTDSTATASVREGERRLAAIAFTDIVGYSGVVHKNERLGQKMVDRQDAIVRAVLPQFGGRVVKSTGDGFLLEFGSALSAVKAIATIQTQVATGEQPVNLHASVHLGDVDYVRGDLYGDGVNTAARLLPHSPDGGIAISAVVRMQVRQQLEFEWRSIGTPSLKNIEAPLEVFVADATALHTLAEGLPAPTIPASPRRSWIKPAAALALVLVVVAAGFGLTHRMRSTGPALDPSQPSVAVLPFANTSGDPENEYFSDGLSEELINSLGRVGNLKVIGRTSSFRFKNTQDDAATIGRKLGVGYLVDGSVRKALDRVRVGISLVRATDGANIWTESYDRELKDIFAVQSEIAAAVTGQLQRSLQIGTVVASSSEIGKPPSGNVKAYQALLQGNFYLRRSSGPDTLKAIEFFEQAVALDPNYALAQANLAYAMIMSQGVFMNVPRADLEPYRARARAAVASALRLAPDLPEAHSSRALELQMLDYKMEDAEKEYRRAGELAPNDPVVMVKLGDVLLDRGSPVPALGAFERAIALDPLVLRAHFRRGFTLDLLGRFDEAEAALKKAVEVEPQSALTRATLAVTKVHQGNPAAAVAMAREEVDPLWRKWALAITLFANGDTPAADEQLNLLIKDNGDDAPSQIAEIYAMRRDPNAVFHWLEHAIEVHDPGMTQLFTSRPLAMYRDDPRYAQIARKVGLDPANAPTLAVK